MRSVGTFAPSSLRLLSKVCYNLSDQLVMGVTGCSTIPIRPGESRIGYPAVNCAWETISAQFNKKEGRLQEPSVGERAGK